jgi:hypothetical protein
MILRQSSVMLVLILCMFTEETGTRRTYGVVAYDAKKDEITLHPIVKNELCKVRTFVRELTEFQRLKKEIDVKVAEFESKEYYRSIISNICDGELDFIREASHNGVLSKSPENLDEFIQSANTLSILSREPSSRHDIIDVLANVKKSIK